MKILIIFSLVLLAFKSNSQVIADPAVDSMNITNLADSAIDENLLPINNTYRLRIPVFNKVLQNGLPPRSCKIKIGLGSKLIVDPTFNLDNLTTSNYFEWTADFVGGQMQITGDLKNPLPANFIDTATFDVIGIIAGKSTITTNFLITNHSTAVILSDDDPTNNSSFLPYTIIIPIPVTFTSLSATKNKCSINMIFTAEREINVYKYEIETSKDGLLFTKIGEVAAANSIHYNYNFDITNTNTAAVIYYRVKSLDKDGRYQYTKTKAINGKCSDELSITTYPNPATNIITVKATTGIFDGSYKVYLYDATGKLITATNHTLVNTINFTYSLNNISSGEYILRIVNMDKMEETFTVQIQKID